MKWLSLSPLIPALLAFASARGDEAETPRINWQAGPTVANLGSIARIDVPEGYIFAGPDDTRTLLELMQNPTSGQELGLLMETNDQWFVLFEFDPVGYVPDEEKSTLDAAAMLASIRKGTKAGNVERRKKGWPEMTITGWEMEPRFNDRTKNLEWAIRCETEGHPVVNHNTRLLGREGVMRVTLVANPDEMTAALPEYQKLIAGFGYTDGHRYAEYRKGDKMAKYGLSALVVGGAAAVAAKAGLFKWLWKLIVIGGVAVAGFFRKLFGGRSGR